MAKFEIIRDNENAVQGYKLGSHYLVKVYSWGNNYDWVINQTGQISYFEGEFSEALANGEVELVSSCKEGKERLVALAEQNEEEENMNEYESKNAAAVLEVVEGYMAELEEYKETYHRSRRLRINDVYDELSIFDWWNEYLSMTQLKDMRKFLKEAIKLGYTGYVCFKVGATYCSNGMWAHTEPSTDGHSPDGCPCLYKSFTPDYNYWTVSDEEGYFDVDEHEYKTIRELEAYIEAR